MIAFLGDVHQYLDDCAALVSDLPADIAHVIQVGDLNVRPDVSVPPAARWRPMAHPVGYIDGNHHYYPDTRGHTAPTLIRPGLTFYPRGHIATIEGCRIGFLGGADSVADRATRVPDVDWWPDEALTAEDLARWRRLPRGCVDLLVSHTPPASITAAMTGQPAHPSAVILEEVWAHLGYPELICGHLHEYFQSGRVEVLPMLGVTFR